MKSFVQRTVAAILIAVTLLAIVPQHHAFAYPGAPEKTVVVTTTVKFVVNGVVRSAPAAATVTGNSIIGAVAILAVPAAVASVVSHCAGLNPPISAAQVVANGNGQTVTLNYERCGNTYEIVFAPYSLGPLAVPAPPAATVVPPEKPAETITPANAPAPTSYNFTVEERPDGTWWCRGGPTPSAYSQGGWHYSDCWRLDKMPWPGGNAAPAPTPAPVPAPAAPTPTGFQKLVEVEEATRQRLAEEERQRQEEERRNRRCPPLPGIHGAYVGHHASDNHTLNENQMALKLLHQDGVAYYTTSGGTAYGVYRSASSGTADNGTKSGRGWQIWIWDETIPGWSMMSTYLRSNWGQPFSQAGNPTRPPAAGCRPVTQR